MTAPPGRRASRRAGALLAAALTLSGALRAASYPLRPEPALASPTAASSTRLFLAPWVDARKRRDLWMGADHFQTVEVAAEGLSREAESWSGSRYGSVALLWHRQWGRALAAAGFDVAQAPAPDPGREAEDARSAGARRWMGGEIQRLDISKRGADDLIGTNVSGTLYTLRLELRLRVHATEGGASLLDRRWTWERSFRDAASLGSRDSDTFPRYFQQGLEAAAQDLAQEGFLRGEEGLPSAPKPGGAWINPKTGHRVDPSWNFDPEDGSPRKDFVQERGGDQP